MKEEDLQNLSLVDSNINFNDFSKESNDFNNDDQALENDQENMNTYNELNNDVKPKCIPTPVIQRLASITNHDNKGLRLNNYVTPLRSYPEEPTYSPYYYYKN